MFKTLKLAWINYRNGGLPNKETTESILKYINEIRTRINLPEVKSLLKGKMKSTSLCPIARTVKFNENIYVSVLPRKSEFSYVGTININNKNGDLLHCLVLPKHINQFALDFDAGYYKNLKLDKNEIL